MSKSNARINCNVGGSINVVIREVDNAVIVQGMTPEGQHKETAIPFTDPNFEQSLQDEVASRTTYSSNKVDEIINNLGSDYSEQKAELDSTVTEIINKHTP